MKRPAPILPYFALCLATVMTGILLSACSGTDGPLPGEQFSPYNRLVKNYTNLVNVRYVGEEVYVSGPGRDLIQTETDHRHPARLTIRSEADGMAFFVYGKTGNGQLKIYSSRPYALYLNNATIKSSEGAAIDSQCDETCYLVLCNNSKNALTDSLEYPIRYDAAGMIEENNACLYTRGRLVFDGTGTLDITSSAASRFEPALDDSLYIHGINALGGIETPYDVKINISATGGDALHAEDSTVHLHKGTLNLAAARHGICNTAGDIVIEGGNLYGTAGYGKFISAPAEHGLTIENGICFGASTQASDLLPETRQYIWQATADTLEIHADIPLDAYVGHTKIATLTPRSNTTIKNPYLLISSLALTAEDEVTFQWQ